VNSIDDLTCDKHPGTIFEIVKTIPDSQIHILEKKDKEGLNVYQCKLCGEDKRVFDKSKAYDCPICGIVIGKFESRFYSSSKESWEVLAGREGEHYHCRICGTQLGSYYWKTR
jgi:hypothetical protein